MNGTEEMLVAQGKKYYSQIAIMKETMTPIGDIIDSLDADVLKRIILSKAELDPDFEQTIRKAAMSRDEVFTQLKAEISEIKCSHVFYDWRSADELYNQLSNILESIRLNINDPEDGVELIADFLSLDECCCNNCDDSDGGLSYEFNNHAVDILTAYANSYSDKSKLTEIIYPLLCDNNYGCHDGILKNISALLPVENIRTLLEKDFKTEHINTALAFTLKDAPLFERLLQRSRPNGFNANYDYPELSECYFEYGDLDKALYYASRIPLFNYKRNDLLEKIYLKTNNLEGLKNIYAEGYMKSPSEDTKNKIIKLFGEEFFEELRQKRIESAINSSGFSKSDVLYLIQNDLIDVAENYILKRKTKISDEYFTEDFLKQIKETCNPLVQTVIFRVPLDYYLNNAKSQYYSTAANYLKYLFKLAAEITDWQDVLSHEEYFKNLKQKHYRKQGFWRYCL